LDSARRHHRGPKEDPDVKERAIGGSGVRLSVVGLGGYELQDDPGWAGAPGILEAALESGINWIDTSEAYYDGMNERTIAAAMRQVRGELLISTKVAPTPIGTGFAPDQIREACTKSLTRLEVDSVDIYLLHLPDDTGIPLEETWAAMRGLVDDGLVRAAGLSNFTRQEFERCLAVGPVDATQDCLSAIDHLENRELFRWCAERGIAVVTYEPLANGMLAGAIRSPEDFARVVGDDYAEWGFWKRLFSPGRFERSQAVVDGMRGVAERIGCTLAQLALAWNLHQPGVTATLAGSRNPAHVRQNAEAAAVGLTDPQLAELDALIPLGPSFADRLAGAGEGA
jgi:aryl-alcohol dehydrogenase-like predicted oxidoreductase